MATVETSDKTPGGLSGPERLVIGCFVLVNVLVPLLVVDLFPFSRFPMFSHTPSSLSWLVATTKTSDRVNLRDYGVYVDYLGNPNIRVGLRPPGLFTWLGESHTEEAVRGSLDGPGLDGIEIIQYTAAIDGNGHVQVSMDEPWLIRESP